MTTIAVVFLIAVVASAVLPGSVWRHKHTAADVDTGSVKFWTNIAATVTGIALAIGVIIR